MLCSISTTLLIISIIHDPWLTIVRPRLVPSLHTCKASNPAYFSDEFFFCIFIQSRSLFPSCSSHILLLLGGLSIWFIYIAKHRVSKYLRNWIVKCDTSEQKKKKRQRPLALVVLLCTMQNKLEKSTHKHTPATPWCQMPTLISYAIVFLLQWRGLIF